MLSESRIRVWPDKHKRSQNRFKNAPLRGTVGASFERGELAQAKGENITKR
jgi:hypothetical protein